MKRTVGYFHFTGMKINFRWLYEPKNLLCGKL